MKLKTRKSLLASVILLTLGNQGAQAAAMCGAKTMERQGEVSANQTLCLTDYGHYLYVDVPYDNSNVTITTSGGTFSGIDAGIILYTGDHWSGTEEATSLTPDTNDESLSFVSRSGERYFRLSGNITQTSLLVSVSGGDIPPPMGDYIIYDTNISVDLPAPAISSKAQYGSIISTVLAASYSDFEALASAANDPLTDVTNAIHYLASADDITDPDLNQLLYFMGSYKFYAATMTGSESANLSIALQAVATMSGFLSADGGAIQEGYAKALNNFERNTGAAYYAEQLPHLLALIQYYSLQTNPFGNSNFGDAAMAALNAVASGVTYGDAAVKAAYNDKMLDVLSVMRSFALLGETALDKRWSSEDDIKWILPHSFNALGKIAALASDEAKARLDSMMIDIHDKVILDISTETTQTIVTKNYLESAGRQCQASDPLSGYCVIPPKEEDILTVSHQCTDKITIRAQSTISQATLAQSCADMAEQENQFHDFFNTRGNPVANDKNDTIEVIAFASPEDYEKYAPEFFGIATDNGGMYLEGTPEITGNQARFIAMQCPDAWVGSSCQYEDQIYNLRHEFVHYLDGRYIKAGAFNYYDYNVSWAEGMAEYMAMGANHSRTLNTVEGLVVPPLYNLLFMAYGYDELYPWSYFAMRYLSETHPNDIQAITAALQAGDKDNYVTVLQDVAARTQDGFAAFVTANSAAVAPAAETIPATNTIGSCSLQQQYVREIDAVTTQMSVTNTTDTPVSLFWLDRNKGTPNFDKNYQTLAQGESYTASTWREADRLVMTDNNLNCLGVAVMTDPVNSFTIDAELVKDVVPENIPALNEFGSCDLMRAHLPMDESHEFSITNTTDYPVSLFRVDNKTGQPLFDKSYGTLAKGESYSADFWFGNRRVMVADARLNCLGVAVLDQPLATYSVEPAMVEHAAEPEVIPEANTIGSCDLVQKHLIGDSAYNFSITNTTATPVNLYRIDNITGLPLTDDLYKTLAQGESYQADFWFGKRRVMIADSNNACLGVAVLTEADVLNDFQFSDGGDPTPSDCGNPTVTGGRLEQGQQQCISGGTGYYYVWVDQDNTSLTITTSGGEGDVDIHFNADTWADANNAQASSATSGTTEERLTVVANRGWRYVTLGGGDYSGVSVTVE